MAFYDRIAAAWDRATGSAGGPFKRLVLNPIIEERLPALDGLRILEIGAGNGYFARWLLERRRGQNPASHVVSEVSAPLLAIAWARHRAPGVRYLRLDAGRRWPFAAAEFDLVLATMVLNEVGSGALRNALSECARVLEPEGRLLATVLHPRFVHALNRRGQIGRRGPGRAPTTMPGPEGLRLPVVPREIEEYDRALRRERFSFERVEVAPTPQVLAEKPGLRSAGRGPLALVYDARSRGA
ncbi:MAG: class I SAM-dependent methyltransferase [Planctomycetales bacterium]|nr:class I SAM-dependent methyltransferase [Planctomycetales bacterium]